MGGKKDLAVGKGGGKEVKALVYFVSFLKDCFVEDNFEKVYHQKSEGHN